MIRRTSLSLVPQRGRARSIIWTRTETVGSHGVVVGRRGGETALPAPRGISAASCAPSPPVRQATGEDPTLTKILAPSAFRAPAHRPPKSGHSPAPRPGAPPTRPTGSRRFQGSAHRFGPFLRAREGRTHPLVLTVSKGCCYLCRPAAGGLEKKESRTHNPRRAQTSPDPARLRHDAPSAGASTGLRRLGVNGRSVLAWACLLRGLRIEGVPATPRGHSFPLLFRGQAASCWAAHRFRSRGQQCHRLLAYSWR